MRIRILAPLYTGNGFASGEVAEVDDAVGVGWIRAGAAEETSDAIGPPPAYVPPELPSNAPAELEVASAEIEPEVVIEPDELERLTLAELKLEARGRGLSGYSAMSKDELIEALR